jgi:two-component SAPR family response regulator
MTRIRVLGPIEVQVDGRPVELGGPRQRTVLGMLVAARRGVVSTDRLIEDLWRGQPPPSATASLQAYVSKLRRLLEPGRSPRAPARLLVSAPPGYVLRVPDEQVDAWRFEGLVRQAGELVLWLTRCGGRGWRSPSCRRTHSSSTATGTARRPPGRSEGSPTRRRCARFAAMPDRQARR